MDISRLSTLSLALAVAVFALAYANPSTAGGKTCDDGDNRPKCQTDPPAAGLIFKVEMDGAFVMDQLTTSNGNELNGVVDFTIYEPDSDLDPLAAETWNNVWDVCDIYGPSPFGPDWFTTTPDRKENVQWVVYRYGGGIRVFFVTEIKSDISLEPLSVTMQLNSNCYYHADHEYDFPELPPRNVCPDSFLPDGTVKQQTTFDMMRFSNHARGEKGVAHAEECHQKQGELLPSHSTLTITACPAGTEDPKDCPPSE